MYFEYIWTCENTCLELWVICKKRNYMTSWWRHHYETTQSIDHENEQHLVKDLPRSEERRSVANAFAETLLNEARHVRGNVLHLNVLCLAVNLKHLKLEYVFFADIFRNEILTSVLLLSLFSMFSILILSLAVLLCSNVPFINHSIFGFPWA